MPHTQSFYRLDCAFCEHAVELPAVDGAAKCPNCGAALKIEWSAEQRELARRLTS